MAAALALGGCDLAPDYQLPPTPPVSAYKLDGKWTQATPQDALPRGAWWQVYGDPVLDGLESQIEANNPALAQALARYDAAQGYLEQARSGLFPTLTAGGHADTDKQSASRPLRSANQPTYYGDDLAGGGLSWDIDLWGRIRNQVASNTAEAQSVFAETQAVRLSLEAELADQYVELRGLDAQIRLLQNAIAIYGKALDLTNDRHSKGIASGLDISRAQTQADNAKASLADTEARRALIADAIASLVGTPAPNFSLAQTDAVLKLPNVPADVPSALLQRRPDVAAAERMVASTNANIGVARAAFYPDISLSGLAGFQNTGNDGLLLAPNSYWALGPNVALTLFDAGRHEGELAVAKAANSAAAAAYRGTVLKAFQDVQDDLILLNQLAEEADAKSASVAAAEHTQALAMALYRNGALGFLDVVVAQTTALDAEQAAASIQTRRLQASIGLIHGIGGGWSRQELPGTPDTRS